MKRGLVLTAIVALAGLAAVVRRKTWRGYGLAAVLFFATLGLIGAPTAGAAVIDFVTWNGNDYYLISENTATGAEIEAQSLGGHLATITSQEEQDFLWSYWRNSLGSGLGLWIGLTDRAAEADFVWLDGEPVTFTNWMTSKFNWTTGTFESHFEPSNGGGRYEEDYVVMEWRNGANGKWNDVPDAGPGWRRARAIVKVRPAAVGPAGHASATDNGLDPQSFSTGNEVTVATLNLPAGSYVLHAKVLVGNRSSSAEQATCSLRFGASESGLIDIADARPFAAGSYVTLPLAGSISLSSSETIKMICATTSTDAFAQYPKLNAVKVETLNSQ